MSAFVVTTPATEATEEPISPGAFWPDVDPAAIRLSQRIDETITSQRLKDALIEAMATVNGELANWRDQQKLAGINTLAGVDADKIDNISIHVHRYLRAVGCLAKASLIERSNDYDTTAKGERKIDALEPAIDDLRRDASWAIRDIQSLGRSTVELI